MPTQSHRAWDYEQSAEAGRLGRVYSDRKRKARSRSQLAGRRAASARHLRRHETSTECSFPSAARKSAWAVAAWDRVAADVNRWATEDPDARCANRSGAACDSQWRKVIYKKFNEGKKMSEIATGPPEKTADEWQPVLVGLGEQWDELTATEARRKEGHSERKAERQRGSNAQSDAADALTSEEEEDTDGAEGKGKSRRGRLRGTELLSSNIGNFVVEQERSSQASLDLTKGHHREAMEEAQEVREQQRQEHREKMELEHRRLDIEQEKVRKETDTEKQLRQVQDGIKDIQSMMQTALEK
ncbi:hypothetical protein A4X13_0g7855 [Tilletia indica]|uniref:Uncharacterized protein n=1 Tax=Tilletia indica TaxID=43049 RepID=A0A177T509_9BASI|nr:hypothetical protein A4X13_0g7855 [Tilletia indica]